MQEPYKKHRQWVYKKRLFYSVDTPRSPYRRILRNFNCLWWRFLAYLYLRRSYRIISSAKQSYLLLQHYRMFLHCYHLRTCTPTSRREKRVGIFLFNEYRSVSTSSSPIWMLILMVLRGCMLEFLFTRGMSWSGKCEVINWFQFRSIVFQASCRREHNVQLSPAQLQELREHLARLPCKHANKGESINLWVSKS
jgi:hypothetical protein